MKLISGKKLIIMVGPIGSGKTTFSKMILPKEDGVRISGDEQGRLAHRHAFDIALVHDQSTIIVDRMGFNRQQRMRYIQPAREKGYKIVIYELKVPYGVCLERVMARQDHPTVNGNDEELARKILNMYVREYEKPSDDEWDEYYVVETQEKSQVSIP